jgi:hypothetical protein
MPAGDTVLGHQRRERGQDQSSDRGRRLGFVPRASFQGRVLPPAQVRADIAASFQHVALSHLIERLARGVDWARELVPGLRHLVVAGGCGPSGWSGCPRVLVSEASWLLTFATHVLELAPLLGSG